MARRIERNRARFVFILSYGRSGSTILADMLARHPDVGFISNVDDRLPGLGRLSQRFNSAVYRRVPQRFTEKGEVLRFAPSEGWRSLGAEVSPVLGRSFRTLSAEDVTPWLNDRLARFFEQRAAVQGRPVFVHKFTGKPHAGLLRAVFPEARFIHLVRDGRAVVDSDLRTSWWPGFAGPTALTGTPFEPHEEAVWREHGRSHAVLAALAWRRVIRDAEAVRKTLPASCWVDVRFEDLVQDREQVFKTILDFAELTPSPVFDAWLKRTVLYAGRTDSFRRNLTGAMVEQVESVIGDELARWGYV